MHTRSSSNLPSESPSNPTSSNTKRRNRRRSKQPFILKESPVDTMADQRTMAELLQAPIEGYAEAIVVPLILAEQFELNHSLINMTTSDQFFRLEKGNPHDHICWFNKITSTIKYKDVPNSVIKLMLFPFSLAGASRRWLEKESRFDESFHEAWDRYKDLVHACPHHGFTELHQLNTFYNALNLANQDYLNSVAGGNLVERPTQDVLTIIENKSKDRNSRNKSIVSQVKSSDANSSSSSEIAKLTHAVNQQTSVVTTAMTTILKQFQATPPPASVKAVEESYVTCGGAHPYYQCLAADGNTFPELQDNIQGYVSAAAVNYNQALMSNQTNELKNMMASFFQMNTASTSGSGPLLSNTIANPKGELKAITTRSSIVLDGPSIPMPLPFFNPKEDERCKALADLGASINLMPLSVWKKLGLPELISTRMTLELANRAICTPARIVRDVFVLVGKFTFPVDFVIIDYESDPRVPLILGRPFLQTARALIDVHGEEMILQSINMINIFNDSCEDFLEDLFATNLQIGNPTFSSHPDLTSPEVKDDIFDPEEGNVLIEKLLDLDSTKDLPPPHNINPLNGSTTSSSPNFLLKEFADELALIIFPPGNDDLLFDIKSDLKEIEYFLNHDPIKDMDSILEDLINESNLANLNDNLVDTMPVMFIDEHALDYSSPPLYAEYDDDLF
nr:reverse transcriptase domain-containing protein [Tanacetum cinerariifolium]